MLIKVTNILQQRQYKTVSQEAWQYIATLRLQLNLYKIDQQTTCINRILSNKRLGVLI